MNSVVRPAVDFPVAFLAAETADFARGQAFHAEFRQSLSHCIELERLDNRDNELHGLLSPSLEIVTGLAMRRDIEPFELFVIADAEADNSLHDETNDGGGNGGPCQYGNEPGQLHAEL